MKRLLAALLLFILAPAMGAAQAENKPADAVDMQVLQKAMQGDKRAYVASMISLTPQEAKKFWPLYDAYQRDLDASNRRRVIVVERLIGMERPPSDLYAKTLSAELLAADDMELKARKTLQSRLMKALPARKAARYLQLESKMRALNAYNIAVHIPLVN